MSGTTPAWLGELAKKIQTLSGVPVYCSLPDAGPYFGEHVRIVFPMNEEVNIHRTLRRSTNDIMTICPPAYRHRKWIFRTILFHMAYERYAPLSSEREGFFVSTNFRNLQDPHKKQIGSSAEYKVFEYDIDIVIVAVRQRPADMSGLLQLAENISAEFNSESEYLRIRKLRYALTNQRVVTDLTYKDLYIA